MPVPDNALANRHDRLCGADPAHHCFVPDAHAHDVVTRKYPVLTPMLRGGAIRIAPGSGNARVDRNQLADISARDHLDDRAVEGQRMGRGDDLGG